MPLKEIELSKILLDCGTQTRVGLNQEHVEDLAEAFGQKESKGKIPPVDVFQTFAGGMILADGFHRVAGAIQAGLTTISAQVYKGEKPDALKFALGCNQAHGLRRTNADKNKSLALAIAEFKDTMTVPAYAELCAVSNRLARDVYDSVYPAKPVQSTGTPPAPPSPLPPVPPPPAKKICKGGAVRKVPAPPLPKPKPKRADKFGREIPEAVLPLWDRAEDAASAMNVIRTAKGIVQKGQDDKDLVWAEVNVSSVKGNLDQAFADAIRVKPHAVCPTCSGLNVSKCSACKGRGYVSEFYWKQCVPSETRKLLES